MNWILLVMGAIVSIVAAVIVGGLLVPATYDASRTLVVRAKPAAVQRTLLELAQWPVWMALARTPQVETSTEAIVNVSVWTDDQQRASTLRFVIDATPEGTRVTVSDRGTVANPVSRLLRHYVTGHHATADATLRALADALGESATEIISA